MTRAMPFFCGHATIHTYILLSNCCVLHWIVNEKYLVCKFIRVYSNSLKNNTMTPFQFSMILTTIFICAHAYIHLPTLYFGLKVEWTAKVTMCPRLYHTEAPVYLCTTDNFVIFSIWVQKPGTKCGQWL